MFTRNVANIFSKNCSLYVNPYSVRNFTASSVKWNIVKIQSPEDFKEKVIESKVPVVVDFFATWCNPCRLLTPRLEAVVSQNKGKVLLAKVDIDEQTDLALDYKVSSVPVLVVIVNGKVKDSLVGLQDTDKLKRWIEQYATSDAEAKENN